MSPRDLEHLSDADLVGRVRAGDDGAFDVLFRRHAARVAGVCRRRVPAHEVDDVVQDVFLRAHSRLGQLRDADAVGAWLRSIAVRCCAERHRGPRSFALPVGDDDIMPVVDDGPDVDDRLLREETAHRVRLHLSTLSARDREALWLRDAMEVPIADIAQRFGTTEGSTRVLLTRARRRLKAAYVAVVVWVLGLGSGIRQRLGRLPEMSQVAVGVAAANLAVLAVVVGVLGGESSAPADLPSVEPAPGALAAVSDADQSTTVATHVTTGATNVRTRTPADAKAEATETTVTPRLEAPVLDQVEVRREPADPDAATWEFTLHDAEDLEVLGVAVDGEESSDDGHDSDSEEVSDDSLMCELAGLVGGRCEQR